MRDFPVKEGARCGYCSGAVDAFGCVGRCAESQANRLWRDFDQATPAGPEFRLQQIKAIAEVEIRGLKPEFVSPALIRIYELVALRVAPPPVTQPVEIQGAEEGQGTYELLAHFRDERARLTKALQELQNGPDTLTQGGLRIVLDALYPEATSVPDTESEGGASADA